MTVGEYLPRSLGFRISPSDRIVIGAAVVGAFAMRGNGTGLSTLVLFVVAHFFLFCNVFRFARRLELIWTAVFLLSAGLGTATGRWGLGTAMIGQLPLTVVLVALQVRSRYYVGVMCRRLNPRQCAVWDRLLAERADREGRAAAQEGDKDATL